MAQKLAALALVAAAPVAPVALAGCGQKKIAECNALVQVINAGVIALEKAPKNESDPSGVSDLKAMAEAMDKVATDAGAVQLTMPELRKYRDDYQKMAKEIAKAERELAKAAEERNAEKRAAAESALDAVVKQEDPLVDQLNKFCQSP
jgi:predicted  nucleic acid-binding Zn-ribbon protein